MALGVQGSVTSSMITMGALSPLRVAELHDAGVTAVAVLPHALGSLVEDLGNELLIAELGDGQTTRVQVALLGPGDDRIDDRTQRLSAGLGGLDAVVLEEGLGQALLHGLGVARSVPSFRPFLIVVTHGLVSPQICEALSLQAQAHGLKLVLHFLDRLNTEVTDVEQIVLRELNELTDRVNAGALKAVVGTDGKVQILDLLVQSALSLVTSGAKTKPPPRPRGSRQGS